MGRAIKDWLKIVAAVPLMLAMIACANASIDDDADAADPGVARSEQGQGSSSEHDEGSAAEHGEGSGGEHREGSGGEHGEEGEQHGGGSGEHGEEGGHDEGAEGEESGTYIARGETWDRTRRGARLVLRFDAERGAFVGTVQNTTGQTLCDVRVEVHVDTPRELGPTERTDVEAGATMDVEVSADGNAFERWTAHPEVSSCSSR